MPLLKRELDRDALVALAARQYPKEHVIFCGAQVLAHGKSAIGVMGLALDVAHRRKIPARYLVTVTSHGKVLRGKTKRQPVLRMHHGARRDDRPAPPWFGSRPEPDRAFFSPNRVTSNT